MNCCPLRPSEMTPCPRCSAPRTGETCDVCAAVDSLHARLRLSARLHARRYIPRGARWARSQMEKPDSRPNQSALPPSDRS